MDFLDPKKIKRHNIRLMVGYVLMALMVGLAATILLYQALGYVIDREGRVIQNGLVFVSSLPEGSEVYINGERQKNQTNTRFVVPAGQYVFEVKRNGYHDWRRAVTVEGGTLQRFDYPLLFPVDAQASTIRQYLPAPRFITQSLDRRWLLVQADEADTFELYDLRGDSPAPQPFRLPAEALSAGTSTTGWQAAEWAANNRHLVVRRDFTRDGQASSEYLLLDRQDVSRSQNLSVTLGFTPTVLQMQDGAHDRYYVFDKDNSTLFTASLEQPTPQLHLEHVLAFQSSGESLLYATPKDAPSGKVFIKLKDGNDSFVVRQMAADAAPFLLAFSRFEDELLIAAGASGEGRTYVYRNPLGQLRKDKAILVPVHILKTTNTAGLSVSPNDRYFVAQNAASFAVYDAKINRGYAYELPLETPGQSNWLDGHHLQVLSAGKATVFDYDGSNQRTLVDTAASLYLAPNSQRLYSLTPEGALSAMALRTAVDQ